MTRFSIAIVTALAMSAPASVYAEWGTFQGNAAHTGYVPTTLSLSEPTLSWVAPSGTRPLTGLAVGGGTVFVSNYDYHSNATSFRALDQTSGSLLWSKAYTDSYSTSAPAFANGLVYVQNDGHSASTGNFLHAYDGRTGASVFNAPYSAQWATYLNPTPFGGNIYVGGGYDGGMYSFNSTSGQQNWFSNGKIYDGWTPAVNDLYAFSFTGSGSSVPITGEFRIIYRNTGVTRYLVRDTAFQFSDYSMNSTAVMLGSHSNAFSINEPGDVYPTVSDKGRLIFWDLQDDATHIPHIQQVLIDHFHGQPALANGVLFANNGPKIAAIDELSGNSLWTWTPPSGTLDGRIIATDNVLIAATDTTTFGISLLTHSTLWSYPISGSMALSDNTLYIAGTDRSVYALEVPEPSSVVAAGLTIVSLLARRQGRRMQK
jgi:hypothetical protein